MKIIFTCLFLIPIICFGHSISQEGLWKGYVVQDSLGNEIRYKRQDFIKVKETSILLFQFQEMMSMETGEVDIEILVDTIDIESSLSNLTYNLSHKGEQLKLEKIDNHSFQITYPRFVLTFKKIANLEESPNSIEEYEDFIIGNTLVETDPITNKVLGSLSKSYQQNGKAKYKKLDSNSNWESAFKIVEFESFVFLKGITSAPIILKNIQDHKVEGLKVDYRFDPENVNLSDLDYLKKEDSNKPKSEKPFNIKPSDRSVSECISNLSPTQLNAEIDIAKGISEKQITTIQVQHSYDCNWMLFHEKDFDGFAKLSVKKLLEIDPSLCEILEIPCGYYAERESKTEDWYIYLHEDRVETDSSYITKKAFKWNNTYRVINEMKNSKLVHFEDYYLDTRVLKKTYSYLEGKKIGTTRFYDGNGKLEREVKH